MSTIKTELLALEAFVDRLNADTDPQTLMLEAQRTFDCIDRIRALVPQYFVSKSFAAAALPVTGSKTEGEA